MFQDYFKASCIFYHWRHCHKYKQKLSEENVFFCKKVHMSFLGLKARSCRHHLRIITTFFMFDSIEFNMKPTDSLIKYSHVTRHHTNSLYWAHVVQSTAHPAYLQLSKQISRTKLPNSTRGFCCNWSVSKSSRMHHSKSAADLKSLASRYRREKFILKSCKKKTKPVPYIVQT